ncbi:hypothetical protein K2Z83_21065, partial [Oscillochloris sp. ZM17-4]|nr:hypothetical protein [Oscillochloris sp. ZM17-4]
MSDELRAPNRQPAADVGAVLMTKLTPPPVRVGLVPRARIAAMLDAGLRQGHRLLLISAPAGSGKTTLLTSWLAGMAEGGRLRADVPEVQPSALSPQPSARAWLSLDAGDNDPQRFFASLLAALRRADPGLGAATASLLGGPALPAVEGLVIPLLNELAAAARPVLLVLDDYHLIETPAIHDAVALLVDRQPPQLRLALVTRADPPLPLPRLRAGGQITEVRAADLRFTADEIAAFFRQTTPTPLDAPALQIIGAHTEGWAAGLQLAGLSLRDRSAEECAAFVRRFGSSSQYVIDYLADEVLAGLAPHHKAFLLQTAILDRLCGPLCDALLLGADDRDGADTAQPPTPDSQLLTPDSYSQIILEELERANLFLISLDPQRRWYRYHHLFAEALRAQLDAEPGARARLHRRAAGWFAAQGAWEDGVHHAILADDRELAGQLIGRGGDDLLRRGELQMLGGWLAALPEPFVAARPELACLHAWVAYATGQIDLCARMLAALAAQPPEQLDPRIRGRMWSLQAMEANAAGSPEAIPLATQAIALLGEDPLFCQAAMLALGNAQRLAGETSAAGDTYRAAIGLGRGNQSPYITIDLLNSLAVNLNEQGRRGEALQRCAAAR